MTLQTDNRNPGRPTRRGFTLVELLLVLSLLTIVISVAAPSLSRFFRGRNVDSEAQRFLQLTRYAQSRAVAEGVPMVLWINSTERTYGLHAETGYVESDSKELIYPLAENVKIEATPPEAPTQANPTQQLEQETEQQLETYQQQEGMLEVRFQPDGFPRQDSPPLFKFSEEGFEDAAIQIAQSRNGMSYELLARTR